MMSQDTALSLTPPVSPTFAGHRRPEGSFDFPWVPWFTCPPGQTGISVDSYLASDALKRLFLRLDPAPTAFEVDVSTLFGFAFVTETALEEKSSLLFGLLRQAIMKLQNMSHNNILDFGQLKGIHCEAEGIRKECVKFMLYVRISIYRWLDECTTPHTVSPLQDSLPARVLAELSSLLQHLGSLGDFPAHQPSAKVYPPSWHLFHLNLDMRWACLDILYRLQEKTTGFQPYRFDRETPSSFIDDLVRSLMTDLVQVAVNKHNKLTPFEEVTQDPFPCGCVREMWTMVLMFLDHRHKTFLTQPFWAEFSLALGHATQGGGGGGDGGGGRGGVVQGLRGARDPLAVGVWLLANVASLGVAKTTRGGEEETFQSNWPLMEEFLRKCFDSQHCQREERLRATLIHTLSLCDLWEPSVAAVAFLWEFYSKRLNDLFNVPRLGLQGLVNAATSPALLLADVRACCPLSPAHRANSIQSRTSFQLFVAILSGYLIGRCGRPGVRSWAQIKGRIYSKFHKRRMQDLCEAGIHNFVRLFLSVAVAVAERRETSQVAEEGAAESDLQEVTSRMLELLDLVNADSMAVRLAVWRGLFSLCHLRCDSAAVAPALLSVPSRLCSELGSLVAAPPPVPRGGGGGGGGGPWWPLVASYLEWTRDALDSDPGWRPWLAGLLAAGLADALRAASSSSSSRANWNEGLKFLCDVVATMRDGAAVRHGDTGAREEALRAVAGAVWRWCLPVVSQTRRSDSASELTADVAAGLTLFAVESGDLVPDCNPRAAASLLRDFAWDEALPPPLACRFLTHVIPNGSLRGVEAAEDGAPGFDSLCVRVWIRCVLYAPTADADVEQLQELTRQVLRLPEVVSLVVGAGRGAQPPPLPSYGAPDPQLKLSQLFQAVGRAFSESASLSERSALASLLLAWLPDLARRVRPAAGPRAEPAKSLAAYRLCGSLVSHCSPLLAIGRLQPMLFQLLDTLLQPGLLMQPGREAPAGIVAALTGTMALFLQGMSRIFPQLPFLPKILSTVVRLWFHRLSPPSLCPPPPGPPGLQPNPPSSPFLAALTHSFRSPVETQVAAFRKHLVVSVRDHHLQFRAGSPPPPRLAHTLCFLRDVFQRSRDVSCSAADVPSLLPSALRVLAHVQDPAVRSLASELLSAMMEMVQSHPDTVPVSSLLPPLSEFLREGMSVQPVASLGALHALSPALLKEALPTVAEILSESERKSGLGRELSVRQAYSTLLSSLGEVEPGDITSLDSQDLTN
ncbi:protein MMS22-like [Lampetra planeri]